MTQVYRLLDFHFLTLKLICRFPEEHMYHPILTHEPLRIPRLRPRSGGTLEWYVKRVINREDTAEDASDAEEESEAGEEESEIEEEQSEEADEQ